MATTYISRTPGSEGNKLKWTFSCWIKRANTGVEDRIMTGWSSTSYESSIVIDSNDRLRFMDDNSGVMLLTTRLFRDPSAWYHIVGVWDSANVTSGERMILYVNGVRETVFNTETYPAQDKNSWINDDVAQYIGKAGNDAGYFNGDMSNVQFVDGQALAPTEFGEVDSISGIWKIKTGAYATPGTNGFFLKMEDRTNLDLDSSSNGHTFTTGGNLTATYDNPSNNFCTMNPLDNYHYGSTFSNGNLKLVTGGSGKETYNSATMGVSAGLWYYEVKINTASSGDNIGYQSAVSTAYNDKMSDTTNGKKGFVYKGTGGSVSVLGVGTTSGYATYTGGDVIGVYLDLTANKIYVAKDGVIGNSGTGLDATAIASVPGGVYYPCVGDDESNSLTCEVNFGNGYFGTTAVTSAVADEGGIGAFEYDPSDGGASSFDSAAKDFRAICTKNIKAYGG